MKIEIVFTKKEVDVIVYLHKSGSDIAKKMYIMSKRQIRKDRAMRKRMIALLTVGIMAISLAACGSSQEGQQPAEEESAAQETKADDTKDTIRVGMSFNALMNDVFVKTDEYTKQFGSESTPKVEFIVTSADNDVSKQISDVKDLISQNPDVICISPEDVAASDTMIKECQDAGIPVMIQNRPYNPDGEYKPDTFVGVDAEDQGYASVKAIFDQMIEAGETEMNLVICSGSLSDQNSVDRVNGVKRAVEEYADKGAKIVTDLDTDWDPDWLESNLPSTMRANPDVNCLYIASDYLLPAAKSALQSTDQWIKTGEEGHIYIASTDVYQEGLDEIAEGYVDADSLMDIVNMSKTIVDQCIALANGETVEETYVKGPVFTQENYQDEELTALLWG